MYASIVRAIEKLERQAIKSRGRLIETKRQKAKARSLEEKSGVSRARTPRSKVDRSAVIMEEDVPRNTMAVEEAVAELEQSEYPFVVFRNVESGSVNVLYRRKDGSLSLIQEE
jgi:putative sigma-54 modulation protein